jgi:hypothetical protein
MKRIYLALGITTALFAAEAIAADVQNSTMSGTCENWSLANAADLKACQEQMSLAKTESERRAVQKRFMKGTNTSGVDRSATTGTSTSRSETGPTANPGGPSNPGSAAKTPGGPNTTNR